MVRELRAQLNPQTRLAYVLPVFSMDPSEVPREAIELEDAGIDLLIVQIAEDPTEGLRQLEWFETAVRPLLSDAAARLE